MSESAQVKRLLLISPFPTERCYQGGSIRISEVAELLESMEYEVHFALLPENHYESDVLSALRTRWRGKLYCFTPFFPATFIGWRFKQVRDLIGRLATKMIFSRRGISAYYINAVDMGFTDWWTIGLLWLSLRNRFDVVVSEYIFRSRALLLFPNAKKVIDTIDVFGDRNTRMGKKDYSWWSVPRLEEERALERCDVILAIQSLEAQYFRESVKTRVVCLPHCPTVQRVASPGPSTGVILAVCSNTALNADGLRWFCNSVIPLLHETGRLFTLRVVGGLARIPDRPNLERKGIVFVGEVDDTSEEYRGASLVVNFVLGGTGMAIKTAEALAFGKACISTESGARGFEDAGDAIIICRSSREMAEGIIKILDDEHLRHKMAVSALSYMGMLERSRKGVMLAALT